MDLFPHLGLGLAVVSLLIVGAVCGASAVASHQAWLSALERLASGRSTHLPRSIATVSLFFAGTAALGNAALSTAMVDDLVATAVLVVDLLLALASLLHAAYRVECVREVSTNPKFQALERVPHAANRLEYIRREARALGLPRLGGAALGPTLVRAALAVLAAAIAGAAVWGMLCVGSG